MVLQRPVACEQHASRSPWSADDVSGQQLRQALLGQV